MEILLKKDFESLGEKNDIVTVKNGYARNYLIPNGIASDEFQRITSHQKDAVINYNKGKFNVKASELKDQDIVDLMDFVLDATTNPRREMKSMNIQSYASPEGEIDKNENLARDRAESAKSAVVRKMKKMRKRMSLHRN